MEINKSFFAKYKIFIIIGFTILILSSLRIAWILFFTMSDAPDAIGGKLDLRNWNPRENETIPLDGEWEFYPHTFLMKNGEDEAKKRFLQVPGSWNEAFLSDEESSFGYGTYRLRILVQPEEEIIYSIRVPSVRSSSELYVNGRLLAQSGQPAENSASYIAKNIPYTASFNAAGLEELDIMIHVANYKDTRNSGIIRSMRFGSEEALKRETSLSVFMQQVVSITLVIHALYAIILYFLGGREKRLLYFSLLIFSIILNISLTNDDKVLLILLPINYDWSFTLSNLSSAVWSFALVKTLENEFPMFWRRKIIPFFSLLCGIVALLVLLLPTEKIFMINSLYFVVSVFAFISTIFAISPKTFKKVRKHFFILIAMLALTNNIAWSFLLQAIGIKTLYYPLDVVIAVIAFSMIWFSQYFQNYHKAQELTDKLQRVNELKDQFLANTSHELRNPLHGIINLTQAVLEREKKILAEKSIQDLDSVMLVGRRMSYMLNDLLDVMHLKESKITLQKSATNIRNAASGIINMLQFMTEGKPIQIENRIPESFPLVHADENRLIQILFNLLHNAVKFTNQGEVYISAEVKDDQASISVHDTGIGMSDELVARVFEPYEQATLNETSIEGGFGLGLNICQQLVELHGSKLEVHSTLEQGSIFTFKLEISDGFDKQLEVNGTELKRLYFDEIAIAHQSDGLYKVSEQSDDIRPKILAVDDDPLNLKVLKNILPAKEYDVITVTSGEEALEFIHKQQWHLMITDVVMPTMSGYELTKKVRERFSLFDLPIILLTSRASSTDIEHGFSAGANDYVMKPIDAKALRSRVKALTDLQLSINERLRMEGALLQAQIRPHFLFNTLNSIAALSQIDPERMLKLLNEFSNYLRASFDFQNIERLVPIEHELDLVRSYLYIEKERFSKKLTVRFEIDENIQFLIPPLTIQPLVENAIRHGILKRQGGGLLTIRIREHLTYFKVSIEDNGVGMSRELLARLQESRYKESSGIGIVNTHERLLKLFGHGLEITSKLGEGTTISFIIEKQDEN